MFWKKKETAAEKDFSKLNHLPTEVKRLAVNAQTLLNEVQETLADRSYYFDMTMKKQLKTDCRSVEKGMEQLMSGRTEEANVKQLEQAMLRLQTTLNGLRQYFGR